MPAACANKKVRVECPTCGQPRRVTRGWLCRHKHRVPQCRVCQGRSLWGAASAERAAEGLRLSEAPRAPAPVATIAIPGTADKIEVMRTRYFAGLELHHPDDGPETVQWEELDELVQRHMRTLNTARRTRHYRRKHETLGAPLDTSRAR